MYLDIGREVICAKHQNTLVKAICKAVYLYHKVNTMILF